MLFLTFSPTSLAKSESSFDFKNERYKNFTAELTGDWLYYSGELLRPKDLNSQFLSYQGELVHLPHKLTDEADYGTYTTTIYLPNNYYGKRLKFNIPFQFSSYKLYINDKILVQNGFTSHYFPNRNFQMNPQSPSFVVTDTELRVILQVSGFTAVNGGINKKIELGSEVAMSNKLDRWQFMQSILTGCIFLIGVIALLIYVFRKKQYQLVAFSLFCFVSSIWGLFTDEYLYTIFYDGLSWVTATRLTYILPMLVMVFYILYISKSFRDVISKPALLGVLSIMLLVILSCIVVKNGLYQQIFIMVNVALTPFYIYFIIRTIMKVDWKKTTEIITVIGVLLVFTASVHDMYNLQQTTDARQYTFIMIGIFIAIQSFINSYRFAIQWRYIENLNSNLMELTESLDEKVKLRTSQLEESNKKLQSLAFLDGLTGVYNRHYFNENIENLFNKNKEQHTSMGIIILDVDEFKLYNDFYGHVLGDRLLKILVKVIAAELSSNIEIARYGGEEFAILLDDVTSEEVFSIAETIRQSVESANIEHKGRSEGIVTISVGAVRIKNKSFEDANEALSVADGLLYISKETGRNRVNYKDLG